MLPQAIDIARYIFFLYSMCKYILAIQVLKYEFSVVTQVRNNAIFID